MPTPPLSALTRPFKMGSDLQTAPEDIIEPIAQSLDLPDIRNLRLSSRTLATRSSGGPFRRFLTSKHVALRATELRTFLQSMQATGLQSFVQNLYIDGLATDEQTSRLHRQNDPGEEIRRTEEAALLGQIFDELATSIPGGVLPSLTLRVVLGPGGHRDRPGEPARGGPPSKDVWSCANDAFNVVFQALAISKLQIKALNIFNDPAMRACGLSCEQLGRINWNDPGLASSLAPLTSLSLRLSTPVRDADFDGTGTDRFVGLREFATGLEPLLEREDDFVGLAELLPRCPRLEEFDFSFFGIRHRASYYYMRFRAERIFERVVQLEQLPRLKRLRLEGVIIREVELLAFIKRSRPSELLLENIHLQPGTFKSMFEYCSSGSAEMSKVRFNCLYEMEDDCGSMVRFVPHDSSRAKLEDTSHSLEREGESIGSPITYRIFLEIVSSRPSGVTRRWVERGSILTAGGGSSGR